MRRHRTFYTISSIIIVAVIMLGLSAYKLSENQHVPFKVSDVAVKQDLSNPVLNDSQSFQNASPSPILKNEIHFSSVKTRKVP